MPKSLLLMLRLLRQAMARLPRALHHSKSTHRKDMGSKPLSKAMLLRDMVNKSMPLSKDMLSNMAAIPQLHPLMVALAE